MRSLPIVSRCGKLVALLLVLGLGLQSPARGAEATGDRVIHGTVVDSEGKPVPNADVWCTPYAKNRFPVVTARTGIDGAFVITAPPADEFEYCPDRLWAYAPGHSVAVGTIPKNKAEQAAVRLALGPPSNFHVLVTQPDGKPAQDAVVRVPALGIKTKRGFGITGKITGEHFYAPEALVTLTAVTTDELGIAAIPAWKGEDALKIDVVTPSFGHQTCYSPWSVDWRHGTWKLRLQPAGRLRGHVVADGPYPVEGLTIHVKTMSTPTDYSWYLRAVPGSPTASPFLASETTVMTDSQGRFEIPRIACGWVTIRIHDGLNKPYQYRAERPTEFRSDMEELVIRLRKAVHVRGSLRLINSGAQPSQFRIGGSAPEDVLAHRFFANIDDQGRFDFYSLPGLLTVCVVARGEPDLDCLPGGACMMEQQIYPHYYYSLFGECWERVVSQTDPRLVCPAFWFITIPEGVNDFECPPIELCEVRGRVLDEAGKPLPKATIGSRNWGTLTPDEQGRFRLLLDRRLPCLLFNQIDLRAVCQPDGAWRVIEGLGSAAEYEAREIDCGIERFSDGVIGDVVLPLRDKEEVEELRKRFQALDAREASEREEARQQTRAIWAKEAKELRRELQTLQAKRASKASQESKAETSGTPEEAKGTK